ncbi:hypothetical protein BI334_04515 [Moorena producens 3L]|nr:hypothetical protein BI334_04515 [Moorena producens 3L]
MKFMQKKNALLYYNILLSVASFAIFFTGIDNYLHNADIVNIIPLWFIAVFCLATLFLLILKIKINYKSTYLITWCGVFLVISIGSFFLSSQSSIAFQALETRVLSMIFVLIMLVILSQNSLVQTCAIWTILFAVLLGIANNIYEIFYPEAFYWDDVGRSAGFYLDPNDSAGTLTLGMLFTVDLFKPKYRIIFVILVGLGVFSTFSRGGILGWIISVITLIIFNVIPQYKLVKAFLVIGVLLVVIGNQLTFFLDNNYQVNNLEFLHGEAQKRIEIFTTGSTEDNAAQERFQLAKYAWDYFSEKPLLGNGIGATEEWELELNSHNMYLSLLAEHGIIGIFIIPSLIYTINKNTRTNKKFLIWSFAVFILVWCLFNHRILYYRPVLMSCALLAVINKKGKVK